MESRTWEEVGRSALCGAAAALALTALGLRLSPTGTVRPAGETPQSPPDRRDRLRAAGVQMTTGLALGAAFGFMRARVRQGPGALEGELYALTLAACGRGDWLRPLGLAPADKDLEASELTTDPHSR